MAEWSIQQRATVTSGEAMRACIYRWAFRLLQNHHDALDATQEVLLRSLSPRARAIENHQAWLRRITINHCLDRLRARRPSVPLAVAPPDHAIPSDHAEAGELHRAVAAGLDKLSPQQRAVLVAKIYDRETFATIAGSMGLSVSSVKTHYVRALRAMKHSLRHHHGE